MVIEQWLEGLNTAIQEGGWKDFTSFVTSKKARKNQLKRDGITLTEDYGGYLTILVDNCKIEAYLRCVHKKSTIKSIRTEVNLPVTIEGMMLRTDFGVKGIVDCVIETEKAGLLVIDWKTVLHLKNEDEMIRYEIQLALYSRLAMDEYDVEPLSISPRLISLTQYDEKGLPLMARMDSTDLTNIGGEDQILHWTSQSIISGSHCSTCKAAYAREPCRERSNDEMIRASSQRLHDPLFTSGNTLIDLEIPGNRFKKLHWKSFAVSNGDQENERILLVQFSETRGRVEIPEGCVVRCRGKIKFEDGSRTLMVTEHAILE